MSAVTLFIHVIATMALYAQFVRVVRPSSAGAVAYAAGFAAWWTSLFWIAATVGFNLGVAP